MAATETKVKRGLAAAACALLGQPAEAAGTFEGWDFDAAMLYYKEGGGRVSAMEPVLAMRRKFSGERFLSLKFTLDALTGATPNGAVASNVPQTFTRPSGKETYTVAPGQDPLDDTFHDTRFAFNAAWEQPLSRMSLLTLGTNVSFEFDFLSAAGSAIYARDFNERNTRVSLGLSYEHDMIDPVGGAPRPFAAMGAAGSKGAASDTKDVIDGVLGLTQVIDKRTIGQLNYSLSHARGYLNDPYKILSVTDRATGNPARYLYESRPEARTRHALYGQLRRQLARDLVSGSYRFYADDWGIRSHTVEGNYRLKPSERWWVEPGLRFYRQGEAKFYRLQLFDGDPVPGHASADYRLGAFKAYTVGLRYGWDFENGTGLILKAEYYMSRGDASAYPDLDATMFQAQYRF